MVFKLRKSKEIAILVILLFVSVIISFGSNAFLNIENFLDIIKSNIVLGIMSLGMLLVILTGGIDVSVASMISAVTVIIGGFMMRVTGNIFLVFVIGCLAGTLMGLINGVLIAKLKIPPIVVTLGMMSVIIGLVLYITNGNWITGIPENFIEFGRITVGKFKTHDGQNYIGIPIQFFFFVFAALLTWFILRFTIIGRGIYAVGGNSNSASRIGYNTDRIIVFLYAYEGFLVGLAGVVHTTIMRQVDPNAFLGFEMQVIAAVVLGGASVLGGYGSVLGTILGVLLFSVLNNGLILMRIPVFWQKIVVGTVLITTISIDIIHKRYQESRSVHVDIEEI
jgi:ribose/xylose/arabinose/galactoside ABC-type transport system permease subunit